MPCMTNPAPSEFIRMSDQARAAAEDALFVAPRPAPSE